jgi:hypothetical protein
LPEGADVIAGPAKGSGCDKDAEEYNMCHPTRGVALIFNHHKFDQMPSRSGTVRDCENLSIQLKNLGFDIRVHKDFTYAELSAVLRESMCDVIGSSCMQILARPSCRQNSALYPGVPGSDLGPETGHLD